ncbi:MULTISPECIES: hypothetical protein [Breznakia]|uniref:Uncharacterized protein n=1 Tax=Breznakia blatticola TaxID=1754012 RepID=A0A4V3G9A3_9FIRM|nr:MULTISPECIES: hypothetical protein [Breznakia]MDH6367312.1 hypothetical protein [Breznakia sp. PH1-1]MDH6404540.1 hypothetical protein [Breznakia sp. PF1-11]MDH6412249.1 hypothetical protein [Breznakia sp. PFB1-11]MDH6414479.1 hypothetical protein [Breznakia sp. PFB1-14]MDH6416913.1 hypothetical protein [Breznakia sp. PFB1-4]
MLTFLFLIIFSRIIWVAVKATWSVTKIVLFIFFMPLLFIGAIIGGLMYVAIPLLVVAGIISLITRPVN